MNNFEIALVNKLIKSIEEEPELWYLSIWGIKTEKIEIKYYFDSVSISKPDTYEFNDKELHDKLLCVVKRRYDNLIEEFRNKRKNETKEKLINALGIDSRKDKLEVLNKISEKNSISEKNENEELRKEKLNKIFNKPFWKFW